MQRWHHVAMDIAGWDKKYRSVDHGLDDAPTILVEELSQKLAPGIAIDLACGAGRHALYLANKGWDVTAVDGSGKAIEIAQARVAARDLRVHTVVADLSAEDFSMLPDTFDLVLIAYYLQRDLFGKAKAATRRGGVIAAIVHTPELGEASNANRAAPGELRGFFNGWEILWDYEGPSRDPAHRRPVAEIIARKRGDSHAGE